MSRSQFQSKRFILRHAWLNLWDERMTTGRINQVAIIHTNMSLLLLLLSNIALQLGISPVLMHRHRSQLVPCLWFILQQQQQQQSISKWNWWWSFFWSWHRNWIWLEDWFGSRLKSRQSLDFALESHRTSCQVRVGAAQKLHSFWGQLEAHSGRNVASQKKSRHRIKTDVPLCSAQHPTESITHSYEKEERDKKGLHKQWMIHLFLSFPPWRISA